MLAVDGNVVKFEQALGDLLIHSKYKHPVRLLVRALAPFGVARSIWNDVSMSYECTLNKWVENSNDALASDHKTFGPDYVAFVNSKIEEDLIELLESAEWSADAKTSALKTACQLKQPVVAQVLLRPKFNVQLPVGEDAWLQAISEFMFRPGNAGAVSVVKELEAQVGSKRPRS